MKLVNIFIYLWAILSLGFTQSYDPETGEIIRDKNKSEIQFDPLTGEIISKVKVNSTFKTSINIKQLAYRDANDNFNTPLTWSILGGGISLFSIPPLAGLGIAIGGENLGFVGFLGGVSIAVGGVPMLLAKNESDPSKYVLQQNKLLPLSKEEKLQYIKSYSKEIEKKRIQAIRKGQIGWVLGGFGSILFLTMIFS
ncbi:MAG: hypothetical protein H8E85_01540 [Candidatus Marinimicrobia bacterium]|nr:hypothetical protein [Candidatus Neomarinimicrobiota bacterium]